MGEVVALSLVKGGPIPHCLSGILFQALVSRGGGGVQMITPRVADVQDIYDQTKDVILSLNALSQLVGLCSSYDVHT